MRVQRARMAHALAASTGLRRRSAPPRIPPSLHARQLFGFRLPGSGNAGGAGDDTARGDPMHAMLCRKRWRASAALPSSSSSGDDTTATSPPPRLQLPWQELLMVSPDSALHQSPELEAFALAWESGSDLDRGSWRKAVNRLEHALLKDPHDVAALRLAHETYILLGDAENACSCVTRVLSQWSTHHERAGPYFGHALGMAAFGMQECGRFSDAEDMLGRALSMNPDDGWALVAMLASLEHQGRYREGVRFLRELREHVESSELRPVMEAYRIAFALEAGEVEYALRIWDGQLAGDPEDGSERRDLFGQPRVKNFGPAAHALWRVELTGVTDAEASSIDTSKMRMTLPASGGRGTEGASSLVARWKLLLPHAHAALAHLEERGWLPVSTCANAAMVFARCADDEGARRLLSAMAARGHDRPIDASDESASCAADVSVVGLWSEELATQAAAESGPGGPGGDAHRAMRHVGVPLCRGILAAASGNDSVALAHLLTVRGRVTGTMDGSRSQRDIVDQTTVVCAARAAGVPMEGDVAAHATIGSIVSARTVEMARARALVAERISRHPYSPRTWMWNARILQHAGEEALATAAQNRAMDLGMGQGGTQAH